VRARVRSLLPHHPAVAAVHRRARGAGVAAGAARRRSVGGATACDRAARRDRAGNRVVGVSRRSMVSRVVPAIDCRSGARCGAAACNRVAGRRDLFSRHRDLADDRVLVSLVTSPRLAAWGLLVAALAIGAVIDRPAVRAPVSIGGYRVLAADFHTHSSTWSDGALTPFGLVLEAKRQGLDVIAIIGHNEVIDAKV